MLLLDKMVRSCKVLRCLVLKNCYFFPVKLQPSRRRSLFTLATSMIIFASKAYNILSLISIAKTTLTDRTVCISCSIQSFSFKLFYFPYFPHFLLLLANTLIIYSTVLIADFIQYNMWDCLFCFLRFGFYECFTSIQYNNYYLPSFSMFSMLIADFIQYNNMWDCWFCFLRFGFYEWF